MWPTPLFQNEVKLPPVIYESKVKIIIRRFSGVGGNGTLEDSRFNCCETIRHQRKYVSNLCFHVVFSHNSCRECGSVPSSFASFSCDKKRRSPCRAKSGIYKIRARVLGLVMTLSINASRHGSPVPASNAKMGLPSALAYAISIVTLAPTYSFLLNT